MDGAPHHVHAVLSCVSSPPSPSSAISRGRRKVISDLTPKSQLPVAAPRSGMSTAPSLGSGNLTLSSPLAQRPETGGCDSGCCFASSLPPQLYTLNPVQRPQKEVPQKGEGKGPLGSWAQALPGSPRKIGVRGMKRDVWIVLTTQTDALRHVCIYGIHMLSWQMKRRQHVHTIDVE